MGYERYEGYKRDGVVLILSIIFAFMVFCSCHFPTVSKRFLFGISMAFGFLWVGCFAMLGDGGLSSGLVGTFRVRNTFIHLGMVGVDGLGLVRQLCGYEHGGMGTEEERNISREYPGGILLLSALCVRFDLGPL